MSLKNLVERLVDRFGSVRSAATHAQVHNQVLFTMRDSKEQQQFIARLEIIRKIAGISSENYWRFLKKED